MIKFSKLQGAGNDFVILNNLENEHKNLAELAKKMCHRHFGIGADGLMAVTNSDLADVQMVYYNSDGSRAKMCGNGIRCFSKFVYDKNILNKDKFTVETLDGIKSIEITNVDKNSLVKVDMGGWNFSTKDIPVNIEKEKMIMETIKIDKKSFKMSSVLMGVPHGVIFVDHINSENTIEFGSKIEKMDIFTMGINVNFVQVLNKNHIKVDTWERGAGKTLACGTGACASVIIANALGLVDSSVLVTVMGGELNISINDKESIDMQGEAKFICDGEFYI